MGCFSGSSKLGGATMKYSEIMKYADELPPAYSSAVSLVKSNEYIIENYKLVESMVADASSTLALVYPNLVNTENFNKAAVLYGFLGIKRVNEAECKKLGWKTTAIIPDEVKLLLKESNTSESKALCEV